MTSSSDSPRVSCPTCGKMYRFKAEYAGRKVKCVCGQVMRMPEDSGEPAVAIGPPPVWSSADSSVGVNYELSHSSAAGLAPPAVPASNPGRCPNCGGHVKTTAVICVNCGYDLRTGKKVATAIPSAADDEPQAAAPVAAAPAQSLDQVALSNKARRIKADAETEAEIIQKYRRRDIHLPLILLAVSLVLTLLNALVLGPMAGTGGSGYSTSLSVTSQVLIKSGSRIVIQIPLLLVSIFIVARIFGSNYGTLGTALLKLAALTLLVSSFGDSIAYSLNIISSGYSSQRIPNGLFFLRGFVFWGSVSLVGLIKAIVSYGMFYLLCYILFEMDAMETTVLYFLMFLLPLVVMFLGGTILLSILP